MYGNRANASNRELLTIVPNTKLPMFSSKKSSWTDQIKDKVTVYVDELFQEYRGQITIDLARGLSALAGLIALWTMAIVCVVFIGTTIALLIGWLLSFYLNTFGYIIGFLLVSMSFLGAAYYVLKHKDKYIEQPVFHTMSDALRSPLHQAKKTESAKVVVPEDGGIQPIIAPPQDIEPIQEKDKD